MVGGFHLEGYSRGLIQSIIYDLRQMGVKRVSPTHCTGEKAIAIFADEYGDDYIGDGAGRIVVIGNAKLADVAVPTDTPELTTGVEGFVLK